MNNSPKNRSTRDAFLQNDGLEHRRITKYDNYFGIYDRYLFKLIGRPVTILEIGVQHGGSLQMWRSFLGQQARVIGLDINRECLRFAEDGIEIFICDQGEPALISKISNEIGYVDIIIDDGSHIPRHQRTTFDILFFANLKENGYYIVEDCHTSYSKRYGGGYKAPGSFIEFAKGLSDQVNVWHANVAKLRKNRYSDWIASVSFYSSVVVIEKRLMRSPEVVTAGGAMLDLDAPFRGRYSGIILILRRSEAVQRLVRTTPWLWKVMRRLMYK